MIQFDKIKLNLYVHLQYRIKNYKTYYLNKFIFVKKNNKILPVL